jgi:hypothetical protein
VRRWFFLCTLLVGCAAERRADEHVPGARWLDQVAAAHAVADGAVGHARRAALEGARALAVPGDLSPDDRRRVLQDLHFRLALAALETGDARTARADAAAGLALGPADDEFTANLWIADGRAAAALGEARAASASYGAALAIHERLLERALQGAP